MGKERYQSLCFIILFHPYFIMDHFDYLLFFYSSPDVRSFDREGVSRPTRTSVGT